MSDILSCLSAARWDIYGPIHKALRLGHADLMARLGRSAFDTDLSVLDDLRTHLAFGARHLSHEEEYIHDALDARAPGAVRVLVDQHDHHRARFELLFAAIGSLEHAAAADRPALGRSLYLAFAAFVAEDLEHMGREETETWPLLCDHFTDDELRQMEMAIISSLAPDETIAAMRLMLPAISPAERAGLLSGMKAGAPPEAYAAVIELAARPTLAANDFAELRRLGLAA